MKCRNRATVGTRNTDIVDIVSGKRINVLKQTIADRIAEYNTEVDIQLCKSRNNKSLFNKLKLGFNFSESDNSLGSKVKSIYIKYHDIGKRKLYWTIWEGNKDNYSNYQDFKQCWDPNTKIWKQIRKELKSDISEEVRNLIKNRDPFNRNNVIKPNVRPNISYPKNFRGTRW